LKKITKKYIFSFIFIHWNKDSEYGSTKSFNPIVENVNNKRNIIAQLVTILIKVGSEGESLELELDCRSQIPIMAPTLIPPK
jgi:hypothetical protein